jgi:hypothetical protein
VRQAIVGRAPCELGLPGRLWSGRAVAELVLRRYGVALGLMGAGRLLRRIGLDARAAGADDLLFAVDGRGSFLCEERRPGESVPAILRKQTRLAEMAGRPVRFVLSGGASEGA